MAESHIISGLVKKRGEIKGEIEYLTSQINTLKSNLNTNDKAILLFEPEYQIDSIKTIHKSRMRYFGNGESKSLLLTILKSSGEALETQDIISHFVDLKSITFFSHQEQLNFKSVIFKQLKHYTEQNLLMLFWVGKSILEPEISLAFLLSKKCPAIFPPFKNLCVEFGGNYFKPQKLFSRLFENEKS